MDVETILENLAKASRHVIECSAIIVSQRQIIDDLRQRGQDTSSAQALLAAFERARAVHLADVDRLREELARRENRW
jgi:hypothetical protein